MDRNLPNKVESWDNAVAGDGEAFGGDIIIQSNVEIVIKDIPIRYKFEVHDNRSS